MQGATAQAGETPWSDPCRRRYRLDPAEPAFDVASGEVYNAAIRVRADAWNDAAPRRRGRDGGMASVRFRITAADDAKIAVAAVARFFSPEN